MLPDTGYLTASTLPADAIIMLTVLRLQYSDKPLLHVAGYVLTTGTFRSMVLPVVSYVSTNFFERWTDMSSPRNC